MGLMIEGGSQVKWINIYGKQTKVKYKSEKQPLLTYSRHRQLNK